MQVIIRLRRPSSAPLSKAATGTWNRECPWARIIHVCTSTYIQYTVRAVRLKEGGSDRHTSHTSLSRNPTTQEELGVITEAWLHGLVSHIIPSTRTPRRTNNPQALRLKWLGNKTGSQRKLNYFVNQVGGVLRSGKPDHFWAWYFNYRRNSIYEYVIQKYVL